MNEPKATGEHDPPDSVAGAADRRRPGRVEYRNPILIALLRRSWRANNDPGDGNSDAEDDGDPKVPARLAIAFIVLVNVLLWILIGIGIRLLLG